MVYNTLIDANVTTISGLFVYVSQAIPVFIPMLLFSLFVIVFLASYFAQQRMTGQANIWASASVSGYFIAVVSVIMSLIPNLINTYVVLICIVIAVIGTGMLLASGD